MGSKHRDSHSTGKWRHREDERKDRMMTGHVGSVDQDWFATSDIFIIGDENWKKNYVFQLTVINYFSN